jgi:hypothetical protein
MPDGPQRRVVARQFIGSNDREGAVIRTVFGDRVDGRLSLGEGVLMRGIQPPASPVTASRAAAPPCLTTPARQASVSV